MYKGTELTVDYPTIQVHSLIETLEFEGDEFLLDVYRQVEDVFEKFFRSGFVGATQLSFENSRSTVLYQMWYVLQHLIGRYEESLKDAYNLSIYLHKMLSVCDHALASARKEESLGDYILFLKRNSVGIKMIREKMLGRSEKVVTQELEEEGKKITWLLEDGVNKPTLLRYEE